MVLDKAEIDRAVGVITSIFELREPLEREEIKQITDTLNEFYERYRVVDKKKCRKGKCETKGYHSDGGNQDITHCPFCGEEY